MLDTASLMGNTEKQAKWPREEESNQSRKDIWMDKWPSPWAYQKDKGLSWDVKRLKTITTSAMLDPELDAATCWGQLEKYEYHISIRWYQGVVVILLNATLLCYVEKPFGDFPGGLVVKTPHLPCRGHRFDPWSGKCHRPCGAAKKKKCFFFFKDA